MLTVSLLLSVATAQAGPAARPLPELYDAIASSSLVDRIERTSREFMGVKYVLDPAGEGADGAVDRDPLLPLDAFDCQTYVETVLAVALAPQRDAIPAQLVKLRYRDGRIDFGARLHFPEIDWIPVNTANGVIRDITAAVAGEHTLAVAVTEITRAAWLRALPNNPTQARNLHLRDSATARAYLEQLAKAAVDQRAETRYIPKAALTDAELLARIPDGSIVMIVRPTTSLFGKVGSRQNISHLGFAIRTAAGLMYRHASSTRRKAVVDRPMTEYLEVMRRTRSFDGIVVFEAMEPQN
jgi:hypothetical protein